jgi:hypothetical protein
MGICGEESALLIVKKFNKTISCEKVIYIEDTYQINLNFPRGIVGRRSAGCIGPLNFLIWIAPFLDTEVHSSGALPQNSLTGLTETKSIMGRLRGAARSWRRRWWWNFRVHRPDNIRVRGPGSIRPQSLDSPLRRRIRPGEPAAPIGKVPIFPKMDSSSRSSSSLS